MRKLLGASCLTIILIGSICLHQTINRMKTAEEYAQATTPPFEVYFRETGADWTPSTEPIDWGQAACTITAATTGTVIIIGPFECKVSMTTTGTIIH